MFNSQPHQSGEASLEEASAFRRARFLREAKAAYAAGLARMAEQGIDQSRRLPPDVLFPDEDLYPGGRRDEAEASPEPVSEEDTADSQPGGLTPEEAQARYEATAAVLAERGLGPGEAIPGCVYNPYNPTGVGRSMIRALHPVCVFPGCRMPAVNCDLDHRIDHARGGPTTVANHALKAPLRGRRAADITTEPNTKPDGPTSRPAGPPSNGPAPSAAATRPEEPHRRKPDRRKSAALNWAALPRPARPPHNPNPKP